MDSVWIAAIWGGVTLLAVALTLRRLGRPLAAWVESRSKRNEAENSEIGVSVLERQNEAQLAKGTAAERAELQRAELRQQAAEAEAAAEVAKATIPARIEEAEKVIAARAEGRAQAAKDQALNGRDASIDALKLLLGAYENFRKKHPYEGVTLDEWLGSIKLTDLGVVA